MDICEWLEIDASRSSPAVGGYGAGATVAQVETGVSGTKGSIEAEFGSMYEVVPATFWTG